jgi:hypothetical protein
MIFYFNLDELIAAIHEDIANSNKALDSPENQAYKTHQFFSSGCN